VWILALSTQLNGKSTYAHTQRFYSLYPGVVATNSVANQGFPSLIALPARLILPLVAYSPEQVADTIVTVCVENGAKFQLVGMGGKEIQAPVSLRDMRADGTGDRVWAYLTGLVSSK
jgi:hypothetical protein